MDPLEKLSQNGIRPGHLLVREEGSKKICVAILSEDTKIVITTPPFEVGEGIIVVQDIGRFVHTSLVQHLEGLRDKLGRGFGYMSNSGLDLIDVEGLSYQFADPFCALGKLKLGEKFRTALFHIRLDELGAEEGINLEAALSNTKEGKVFVQRLSKTSLPHALEMEGRFTVFVPSTWNEGEQNPLAYIFAGNVAADFSGEIINVLGESFNFPFAGRSIKLVEKCSNGLFYLLHSGGLPERTARPIPDLSKLRKPKLLTSQRVGEMVGELGKELDAYAALQKKEMLIQLEQIKSWILASHKEDQRGRLISLTNSFQAVFKQARDL